MKILKKLERTISHKIKRLTEFPLMPIYDFQSKKTLTQKIPPNIYQTWEDNLLGKTHYKQLLKFRSINQDLNFYFYDKFKRDGYMQKFWSDSPILQIYKNSKFGNMKSDIFRFCILYERGGYYFDISKGCSVPLRTIHSRDTEALITNEPVESFLPPPKESFEKLINPFNYFLSWGMGFKKNHPIPEEMIKSIIVNYQFYRNRVFDNPKAAILNLMSTGQFTKVVRNYLAKNNDTKIEQSGIYFNGHGIFAMRGSSVRNMIIKHYSEFKNTKIFN
tara:strand:- start:2161 stop:2985 length:825 start_codon:yes stop_codon:yes gene_type:complete